MLFQVVGNRWKGVDYKAPVARDKKFVWDIPWG